MANFDPSVSCLHISSLKFHCPQLLKNPPQVTLLVWTLLVWNFGAAYEDKKPFPLSPLFKLCYTYPTMMKIETAVPYMKRSEKYKNQVKHPLISADISIFPSEISRFCYILK